MIDFHAHVLPGIDDGAKDINMSLEMLHNSFLQGVKTVVATPHCYLMEEKNIESFVAKRNASYKALTEAMKKDGREFPELKLGCELRVLKEIPDMNELKQLCIQDTNYILVEMPYKKWDVNYYDFIYAMQLRGMRPIMAHIERFWDKKKEFYNLYSLGNLLYQINADSFLEFGGKHHIAKLFEEGAVHIIGSDMHNTANRMSRMKKASQAIISGYGKERLDYLMNNAQNILNNLEVEGQRFPKLSLYEKIKL